MTMTAGLDKIVTEALELPPPIRAFLAEKLIESLDVDDGELSPEWRKTIQRRCREIEQGVAVLSDADAVFARAYAALG